MSYVEDWKRLAAKIIGLQKAAEIHARFLAINSSDTYGRGKKLHAFCLGVLSDIEAFLAQYKLVLPGDVSQEIRDFVTTSGAMIKTAATPHAETQKVWAEFTLISLLETQITHLLGSRAEMARNKSELAFKHLERCIVVDEQFRKKWQEALDDGEIKCEQCGALHLLWHGIWAFKVDAKGGRTDLVFPEPPDDNVASSVVGLVLTEWKATKSQDQGKFDEARRQADRYSAGPLAGIELASHRYLVVVSKKTMVVPADEVKDGVTYRHINIVVDPDVPSVSARASSGS